MRRLDIGDVVGVGLAARGGVVAGDELQGCHRDDGCGVDFDHRRAPAAWAGVAGEVIRLDEEGVAAVGHGGVGAVGQLRAGLHGVDAQGIDNRLAVDGAGGIDELDEVAGLGGAGEVGAVDVGDIVALDARVATTGGVVAVEDRGGGLFRSRGVDGDGQGRTGVGVVGVAGLIDDRHRVGVDAVGCQRARIGDFGRDLTGRGVEGGGRRNADHHAVAQEGELGAGVCRRAERDVEGQAALRRGEDGVGVVVGVGPAGGIGGVAGRVEHQGRDGRLDAVNGDDERLPGGGVVEVAGAVLDLDGVGVLAVAERTRIDEIDGDFPCHRVDGSGGVDGGAHLDAVSEQGQERVLSAPATVTLKTS